MNLLCKVGMHKFLIADEAREEEPWFKTFYGVKIHNSEYTRTKEYTLFKCARCLKHKARSQYQDNYGRYFDLDPEYAKKEIIRIKGSHVNHLKSQKL